MVASWLASYIVRPPCSRSTKRLSYPAACSAKTVSTDFDARVDIVSEADDGSERTAYDFGVVGYDQPVGCAAAYYPETNPLIPLDATAEHSNTPTSKSIVVRLMPRPV